MNHSFNLKGSCEKRVHSKVGFTPLPAASVLSAFTISTVQTLLIQ